MMWATTSIPCGSIAGCNTPVLLIFGLVPILLLWLTAGKIIRRYKGTLLVIVVLIMMVSIPWEMVSIDRMMKNFIYTSHSEAHNENV
jgi:hypothetical protein